ncbi:MAG: glycine betaine ABC transporter substrate-binding protein [Mycobacteriaceae bacterium]
MAAVAAVSLSACGLQSGGAVPLSVGPAAIQPVPSLKGVSLTVGSKDFTESITLGYIAELALSAAGANIRDLTNIQGSNSARVALTSGQIDMYFDYTGTGWINYLGHTKPIPTQQGQYEAVKKEDLKKNSIVWTDLTTVNNTYALALNKKNAAKLGVNTLSDYAALVQKNPAAAKTCVETEFASRPDGFPGMAKAYGFSSTQAQTQILATGAIYQSTANGSCTFGEVFTTDGRVKGLDLSVLKDDTSFFPIYDAALNIRESVATKYPAIATVLEPIVKKLTTETMTQLNAEVDVDGHEQADVARDWLVEEGFVTNPNA